MQYGHQPIGGLWSGGGKLAAALTATAIAAGWIAALQPMRLQLSTLATGILLAIGAVVVISRCRMPAFAKAGLLATGCATLLIVIATQDWFGLRAVNAETGSAFAAAANERASRRPSVPAKIASDSPLAAVAADDAARAIDRRLAPTGISLGGTMTLVGSGADRAFRLNWVLLRGDEQVWCGLYTQATRDRRPDFGELADRIAAAAERSVGGPLVCP